MEPITITISLPEILALPGEAAIKLITLAGPDQIRPMDAYDMEAKGKARWVVLNGLRELCRNWPRS
jgi:hypothetical protein